MQALNFCILYEKYYIYIQRLFNNNTRDLYNCLTLLKQALQIGENICIKNKNEEKFFKFHFICDIYKIIVDMHAIMTTCRLPVLFVFFF